MNLSDLIQRKDRSVVVVTGSVEVSKADCAGVRERAIILSPGACLRLENAQQFWILRTLPSSLGLTLLKTSSPEDLPGVSIELVSENLREILWRSGKTTGECESVYLDWPLLPAGCRTYDLEFRNEGSQPVTICHGRLRDSGAALLPLLLGKGVEVGPGPAPFLRPSEERDVYYIERMTAQDWKDTYNKGKEGRPLVDPSLWQRYMVADARRLECIENASLDFVFSKHVLEHLINPIGVFESWAEKLRPGGLIAGVVPDLRYCFDLRQPPTPLADLISDYRDRLTDIPIDRYERWCRFTAPYNTPEDLIRRNYSIHVTYFTADTFVDFLHAVSELCEDLNRFALKTENNNKDFAFAMWKSRKSV